ncbi:MAG TPA: tyrosine-type recombinase/integrase [Gemmataceae bacterium]|jgi:integrase|nr:tyrosine-type recombinase/integrase [Gemmataceae bacterium]
MTEPTITELVNIYLRLGLDDISKVQCDHKKRVLNDFARTFGSRTAAEIKAIEITAWLASHSTWKSSWTYNAGIIAVRRLFNWGLEQELIEKNPSVRIKRRRQSTRRLPMADEHFQTLMRTADPTFRRFLVFLKFTGCRPAEASSMRWRNVNMQQRAVILHEHKTAKKTGRPRVIPLVPPVLKLLVWLRSHKQASVVGLVERFLLDAGGEIKAAELSRKMKPYGVSHRAVGRARAALAVEKVWIGLIGPGRGKGPRPNRKGDCEPWRGVIACKHAAGLSARQIFTELKAEPGFSGTFESVRWCLRRLKLPQVPQAPALERGYYVYRLPADHSPMPDPSLHDFVFINALGNAFTKESLSLRVQRLRKRSGLPKHVTLYELRHRFFLHGIKNRVNLKLLSLAGGHTSTQMTEKYIHEAGLTEDVYEGALQAVYGPGAVAAIKPPPPPRPIEIVTPPPVEQIPVVAEYLPSSANSERQRPQVRVERNEPTNGSAIETMLAEVLKRLPAPKLNGRHTGPSLILPLRPAEQATWQAVQWALAENPALASAKDAELFVWIRDRPDCPHKIPPHAESFRRYLSKGRLFYDQRKRVLRDRVEVPAVEEGGVPCAQ